MKKIKTLKDFLKKSLTYLHLNIYFVRNPDPHNIPHDSFPCIDLDEPLIDAHLVLVPCLAAITAWSPANGDQKPLSRQRYGANHLYTYFIGYIFYLTADYL